MTRGLIVGKFMPLHRGHQFLIESALSKVDDLTVVIYDSKPSGHYPSMPIQKRSKWLADLYPDLENIVPRKDILPDTWSQKQKDDSMWSKAYAKDLDFLGKFDYVFSSESYGEQFAAALGAESIIVDEARNLVPISGTKIRENLFENRTWIDPKVYRTLVRKVVFVGTESAGKSTLAAHMAEYFNTQWVHEYGRELWESQNLTGSFHDQLKIAFNQYRREEAAILHARDYLFCDTNAWTTKQWYRMYNKTTDIRLDEFVEKIKHEYIWILCDNDFGWVDDGIRELTGNRSDKFQKQNQDALNALGVPWWKVSGDIENRRHQVCQILQCCS